MKRLFSLTLLLLSFGAMASTDLPLLSIKERLRLQMWSFGLEDGPSQIKIRANKTKPLPEEIERPLRKL